MRNLVSGLALAIVAAATVPASTLAQTTANRNVEPVVLTGAKVPAWSGPAATVVCTPGLPSGRNAHNGTVVAPPATGVPVNEIVAYRWDGTRFKEIPVQVDQMYPYCLSNASSETFGQFYSSTDYELNYAWDTESWKKTAGVCTTAYPTGQGPMPDPVPTLDNDDEIVFMASDAGRLQAPLGALLPAGASSAQAVAITDPLDAATVRYVYLARKPGGSSFNTSNGYVQYIRDANADQWIDRNSFASGDPQQIGSSNTGYGPNLSGTVCDPPLNTPRASTDRFPRDGVTVSTPTYRFYASGRWMVRDLRVAKPGQPGVYGPDLIDRWKGRAFQQSPDSNVSLVGFEDEQVNWEANSALVGERRGPVRAIRETWGADSGTNVTKTEAFYRDAITYRYHVRVHPIPPDGLYTDWDYNRGVAAKYYNAVITATNPDGVDIDGVNDDQGNVDGAGGQSFYFDAVDPTFSPPTANLQWEQVSGFNDFGSLVYIIEIKGVTSAEQPAVVPYYRDDACLDDGTGDDSVQRPWPGESSTDSRVKNGYCAAAGKPNGCHVCQLGSDNSCTSPATDVDCHRGQTQGAYGQHGVHYFFTSDTDNAQAPLPLDEIDAQQWQFAVPTAAPTNVGAAYGNVVVSPLQTTVTPLAP